MARTTKLNDLQLILLTTAVQRNDGSLLPPPDSVGEQRNRIVRSVAALIKRELAAEQEVSDADRSWRCDGNRLVGATITNAGYAAIGIETVANKSEGAEPEAPPPPAPSPRGGSKQAFIVGLLSRREGATLAEMVEATGWLPHTTRAALTGLRKKGYAVSKAKRGDVTCCHIGREA